MGPAGLAPVSGPPPLRCHHRRGKSVQRVWGSCTAEDRSAALRQATMRGSLLAGDLQAGDVAWAAGPEGSIGRQGNVRTLGFAQLSGGVWPAAGLTTRSGGSRGGTSSRRCVQACIITHRGGDRRGADAALETFCPGGGGVAPPFFIVLSSLSALSALAGAAGFQREIEDLTPLTIPPKRAHAVCSPRLDPLTIAHLRFRDSATLGRHLHFSATLG